LPKAHTYVLTSLLFQEENRVEATISLSGCTVEVASSYAKKRNVLALKLPNGAEFLLQAKDEVKLNYYHVVGLNHFFNNS